jgi:3-hydroxybutyryl-CoA dehydrogenase
MSENSLAIIGESRLAGELLDLSRASGFDALPFTNSNQDFSKTPLVIDTLAGGDQKRDLLTKLDDRLPASSMILTSCIGFATTEIASWTRTPERVVGFATFYPLREKKVIELAGGLRTEKGFLEKAEGFFHALGKEPARVKDLAGLVFPRILSLIINQAARILDEGVASAEEIDTAMRLGTNYPLGPLRWADLAGIDEVLAVLEGLLLETGDDRYRPAPVLRKMVQAGWLGEASGKGFYLYPTKS